MEICDQNLNLVENNKLKGEMYGVNYVIMGLNVKSGLRVNFKMIGAKN